MSNILETFDVVQYLEERNIDITYSGKNVSSSGNWLGVQCVFCGDSSNHGAINLNSKAYSCFRCGKHSILEFIQVLDSCSKNAAWKIAGKYQTFSAPEISEIIRAEEVILPEGVTEDFTEAHRNYLIERKFDPDFLIRKYNLLAGQRYGYFKYRIVAPVILDGKIVTYVGRDITGLAEDRYRNLSAENSKLTTKETLYNLDSVKDIAVIVEGIFDVFRFGDGAVATFGTKVTATQLKLLRNLSKVYILFDAEATNEAYKLASILTGMIDKIEVLELSREDPAKMSDYEIKMLRRELRL